MARKKKSSSAVTTEKSRTADGSAKPETVEGSSTKDKDKESERPDVEEVEEEEEEEVACLQVDTGDVVKVKQVLDETVASTFVSSLHMEENHRLDNVKLSLMSVACLFASIAQFAPLPFPDSRVVLGACCVAYFLLSFVLQLLSWILDGDCIMITLPTPHNHHGLRIRTTMPRFSEYYTVVLEFQGVPQSPSVTQTWSVGKFFDIEGTLDEHGLTEQVQSLYRRFEQQDYDTTNDNTQDQDKVKTH